MELLSNYFVIMTDKTWVKSPYIVWSHTSSKILTMEYIEGIKITDIEKVVYLLLAML